MVLIDLFFHHGGEWIRQPELLYSTKNVHKWEGFDSNRLSFVNIWYEYIRVLGFEGVQQLIVSLPSGKYYEIVDDDGVKILLSLLSDEFKIINLFAVDDCELEVDVENIIKHIDSMIVVDEVDDEDVGSDCDVDDTENEASEYSDYDSEELEFLAKEKKRVITDKLSDYKELDRFMTFKDINEARRYVSLHSLANGYNLSIQKSDKKRFRVVCQEPYNFVCLISGEKSCAGVSVKTLSGKHNKCEDPCGNYKVSATTLAYYFKDKLQANPKYKIKEMRVDLKTAFNINASFGKCKRAKRMILEKMEGSFRDDYKKLVGYANALIESNVGSDIKLKVSLVEGKRQFLRMYVCFDALKRGFKSGLRPFIGVDGTFLKGKIKGQLLCAVGQDSMNHLFPIAWAVVDRETKVTWLWFLDLLQKSLNLNNGDGITLISDMQKGLIEAVRIVLPNASHRYCMRHIEANWRKMGSKSKQMSKVLWWCAWSTYKEELDDHLKELADLSVEAKDHLLHFPIETWCRVYLDTVCKNQKVENNLAESFNSWILEARQKPIIGMLEAIRTKVMNNFVQHEKEVMTWKSNWSPQAIKMYDEFLKIANVCDLNFNGDYGFEISEANDKFIVNLKSKKCSCRAWDLTGIPCPHAIKALQYKELDPMKEIHWWYSKEAYLLTYNAKLQPVPGPKFWKIIPAEAMEPPPLINLAGRPKVQRKRDKDEALKRTTEWVASRKGRIMTCSSCGAIGHNSRGCHKFGSTSGEGASKKQKGQMSGEGASKIGASKTGQLKNKKQKGQVSGEGTSKSRPLKRHRTLIDEEENDPLPLAVEDFPLTAPQPSQDSVDILVDEDISWRPRGVSEFKSRIQQRQQQPKATGTREISFLDDGLGKPSDLYAPKGLSWEGNTAITGRQMEQLRVEKLRTRKGNGKTQE